MGGVRFSAQKIGRYGVTWNYIYTSDLEHPVSYGLVSNHRVRPYDRLRDRVLCNAQILFVLLCFYFFNSATSLSLL